MALNISKLEPELLSLPNIPKPLHEVNPRTIKGETWWEEVKRITIADSTGRCLCCGATKFNAAIKHRLECHETYRTNYRRGTCTYLRTLPLCYSCHAFIHSGFLWVQYEKGSIPRTQITEVLYHGLEILEDNKLKIFPGTAGICSNLLVRIPDNVKIYELPENTTKWGDWRLIFGGKNYPPKFRNYTEWLRHYIKDGTDSL